MSEIDPLATCVWYEGHEHYRPKHDVVIAGLPLCTRHAEEAMRIMLFPEKEDDNAR